MLENGLQIEKTGTELHTLKMERKCLKRFSVRSKVFQIIERKKAGIKIMFWYLQLDERHYYLFEILE
jgi:hypothetical protein